MKKCLVSLCELRSSQSYPNCRQIDQTFATAVRVLGPEFILNLVPLKTCYTQDVIDLNRSWMLPVLRDHVSGTELKFFTKYFLPLAAQVKTQCMQCQQTGKIVQLKTWSTVLHQIWSLLPAFCTQPTDMATAFPLVAQTFGECINNEPSCRLDVLTGLRRLCLHANSDEEKKAIGRYSKNFLPILANQIAPLVVGDDDSLRFAALETLKFISC
jgi:ribosomal RNA-processing protein 12